MIAQLKTFKKFNKKLLEKIMSILMVNYLSIINGLPKLLAFIGFRFLMGNDARNIFQIRLIFYNYKIRNLIFV